MAAVDRNVLRLGAYELLHDAQTPPAVTINEAIELARRYGSKDSPAFVNGVLDRIKQLKISDLRLQIEEGKAGHDLPANEAENRQFEIKS